MRRAASALALFLIVNHGNREHYSWDLFSIVRTEFAKLLEDVVDLVAVFFGKG